MALNRPGDYNPNFYSRSREEQQRMTEQFLKEQRMWQEETFVQPKVNVNEVTLAPRGLPKVTTTDKANAISGSGWANGGIIVPPATVKQTLDILCVSVSLSLGLNTGEQRALLRHKLNAKMWYDLEDLYEKVIRAAYEVKQELPDD